MSAVRKRLYYFWKKASEKQLRKKYTTDYFKDDIKRFQTYTDKKPEAQINNEIKALQKYWDCYPYQYYRFDFFRNDCTLSLEEMKAYVPYFFLYNLVFPVSSKDYGVLCDDKLLTHAVLKAYEAAQPTMLFGFENNAFFDEANSPLSPLQVDELTNVSPAEKLFIKPRFGLGGKGILVFEKEAGVFMDAAKNKLTASYIGAELKNESYIVQEGLQQHPEMNAIYGRSINTFRVITQCVNGETKVLYALIRMGRGGKQVDNASSGGLYIKIDPTTGSLSNFAFAHGRQMVQAQPDTGFVFANKTIAAWPQVLQFVLEVASKFREITYLGWDIALTTNGPAVIEMNKRPDMEMIQDWYGGIANDLKIVPKDWWYRSNYTLKNL